MKNLCDWTRAELLALPRREWAMDTLCDSVLILPMRRKHESGWGTIALIAVREYEPYKLITNSSDDVEWVVHNQTSLGHYPDPQFRMDCCLKSSALQAWGRRSHFNIGPALSTITVTVIHGTRPAEGS